MRHVSESEVEAVLAAAVEQGVSVPTQLPGGMAREGCSLLGSCEAEIAELEEAHLRLLELRWEATGPTRYLLSLAANAVLQRTKDLQRGLDYFRSVPAASLEVRS